MHIHIAFRLCLDMSHMTIQNSLSGEFFGSGYGCLFKGFILKKMHFKVADISLSLHLFCEGSDIPSVASAHYAPNLQM